MGEVFLRRTKLWKAIGGGVPWIISIDDEKCKEDVSNRLSAKGIEVYRSFKDFYVGLVEIDIRTVNCGEPPFCFRIAPILFNKDTIIYSFGIGRNYSFEKNLIENWGCKVFAFDPSPEVIHMMQKEKSIDNLRYFEWGLSDLDGEKAFHIPAPGRIGKNYSEFMCPWVKTQEIQLQVYQLSTIMKNLGHKQIDLLKLDIEGSEFRALPNILQSELDIRQLCIETHARIFPDSIDKMREIKKWLNCNDFFLISNEINEQTYIHESVLVNYN